MADKAFYDPAPATDVGGSRPALENSVFEVFEEWDTAFTTPLPLQTPALTNGAPLVTTAQGVIPPVFVISPSTSHNFRSGDWVWRRWSSTRAEEIMEEAALAVAEAKGGALAAAANAGAAAVAVVEEKLAAGEFKGEPGKLGLPGVNAVPASEAVAVYASTPGNPVEQAVRFTVNSAIDLASTPHISDAVGEWWIHPLATYQASPYPRTVFGGISGKGEILACEFNHATGKRRRVVAGQAVYVDDHNVPALWVEAGHRPVLVWTNHGTDDLLRFKIGSVGGDIASLAIAPEQTVTIPAVSYAQVHHIRARSTKTKTVLWIFVRRGYNTWWLYQVSIDVKTGVLTKDWGYHLFNGEGRQCYISTADAHDPTVQIIRVGVGFNPAQADNQLYYFEINTSTGEVTGKEGANVFTNAGLPLNPAKGDLVPIAPQTDPEQDRRFFYTRPGPDAPALAYADWPLSNPDAARYTVLELGPPTADPVDGLVLGDSGYAQTTLTPAQGEKWADGFTTDVFLTLAQPLGQFEWRIGAADLPRFRMKIAQDGTRNVRVMTDTGVASHTSAAATFAAFAGQKVGMRMTVDMGTKKIRGYYSADNGATWTQIGTTGTDLPADSTYLPPADGLQFTLQGGAAAVERTEMRAPDESRILGVDFRAWPLGASSYSAGAERWALGAGAYIASTKQRVSTRFFTFGTSGKRVGHTAEANYVAGMSFENPSRDGAVITAHSDGRTETVRKHWPAASGYASEVLRTQPTQQGRLIRPYSPVNSGPIPALITQITRYASFQDFDGNFLST